MKTIHSIRLTWRARVLITAALVITAFRRQWDAVRAIWKLLNR